MVETQSNVIMKFFTWTYQAVDHTQHAADYHSLSTWLLQLIVDETSAGHIKIESERIYSKTELPT